MGKYALTRVLDFGKGKRVELYQEGKQIKPNGDFSLPEVLAEFKTPEEAKAFIRQCGEKYYVNLKEINALSLRQVGIRYIEISDECTMCQPDRYWSHRITGSARGSQGGLIVCKEVRP